MKHTRKVIHIARHIPTGAEVPVIIKKADESDMIEDYEEYTEKRKGFTLSMLQNRWNKAKDDILEILSEYQVPAHIKHEDIKVLMPHQQPIDVAIFFEEYILALEKKGNISHNKLKSKSLESLTEH